MVVPTCCFAAELPPNQNETRGNPMFNFSDKEEQGKKALILEAARRKENGNETIQGERHEHKKRGHQEEKY
jgi:hypothetical protein